MNLSTTEQCNVPLENIYTFFEDSCPLDVGGTLTNLLFLATEK